MAFSHVFIINLSYEKARFLRFFQNYFLPFPTSFFRISQFWVTASPKLCLCPFFMHEKGRLYRRRPAFSFRLNLFDSCMPFYFFRISLFQTSFALALSASGIWIPRVSASFLLITVSYSFWWRIGASAGFTLPSRMSAASSPVSRPSL